MPSYKLIIQSGIVRLKTGIGNLLNINGIKDKGTGTGAVTNNLIDWKLLDYSDTAANLALNNYILGVGQKAFTTDLLYPGTNQMRWKVGNGVDTWSNLDYVPFSSGGTGVQSVTGPDVDDNDPQNPIVNTPSLFRVTQVSNQTSDQIIIKNDVSGLVYKNDADVAMFEVYKEADGGGIVLFNDAGAGTIELNGGTGSIKKNGDEVATQNEVSVVQSDINTHEANTSNPHNVTKSQVGLGNVDNTSDANKPVSTAQQTALNLKDDAANKSTSTALGTSNTLYPTQNAVKTYVDSGLATKENALTITAEKNANYSIAANEYVPVDLSSGNVTLTIPTAPADKTLIGVKIVKLSGTNSVTINLGGTDKLNTSTGATSANLNVLNHALVLEYKASVGIWYVINNSISKTYVDTKITQNQWVNYSTTSVVTGLTGVTSISIYYIDMGEYYIYKYFISGPASGTSLSFTLHVNENIFTNEQIIRIASNGVNAAGLARITPGTNVVNCFATPAGGAFSSSGTKAAGGVLIINK